MLKQHFRRCRTAILAAALACFFPPFEATGQYGGPSLLSRGGNRAGHRGRAPMNFNIYGGIRSIVETGLTPVVLEDTGEIASATRYGAQAEIGAYGAHYWRRSSIGLDYRGDYRQYSRGAQWNGSNHAMSLSYMNQLTRRITVFGNQVAGTSNRAFGGFAAPSFADADQPGVPLDEVFDVRNYNSQTTGGIAYRRSARMTIAGTGDVFFVKRSDPRLIGVQGARVSGQVGYQLNARNAVGGTYGYTRYEFPRAFGSANIQLTAFNYTRQISTNWVVNTTFGAGRISSIGTQRVILSPEIAAILGRSTGVEAFQRTSYIPYLRLNTSYTLERSRFFGGYITGVTPGNGIYMTSRQDGVRVGYSYNGIRKMALGLSAGYSQFSSLAQELRGFRTSRVGGGMNYAIGRSFHFSSQVDYRKFSLPNLRGREGFVATVGLMYSPSRFPLSIW